MIWRGLYRGLTGLAAPLARRHLRRRAENGKEDAARLNERFGIASHKRPEGAVIWVHAASIGEAMSALGLIDLILQHGGDDDHVLMTTGTRSSAILVAERFAAADPPGRCIHQYVPLDRRAWVARFLDHWQPDLAIWIESELWPNLIWEMRDRNRPMALINGRISARSLARWRRLPGLTRELMGCFSLILAQTPAEAARFAALGATKANSLGNLKFSAPPLPVDARSLADLRAGIAGRPVWLAASTHAGEDMLIAQVHRRIAPRHPGLLTLLIPRHPARGPQIAEEIAAGGLRVARRAGAEALSAPAAYTEIYIADTLGELGLFYRLTEIAFIGGSLGGGAVGGHNPIEAAQLECAMLFGPDMGNFETVAAELVAAGAARVTADATILAHALDRLLGDGAAVRTMAGAGGKVARRNADVAARVYQRLQPLLPPAAKKPGRS